MENIPTVLLVVVVLLVIARLSGKLKDNDDNDHFPPAGMGGLAV